MSNNPGGNRGGKTKGDAGDYRNLHLLYGSDKDKSGSDSDKDSSKQESTQSSDGKSSSSRPDASDDTTSDDCKQRSIRTEDENYPDIHANEYFWTQLIEMLNGVDGYYRNLHLLHQSDEEKSGSDSDKDGMKQISAKSRYEKSWSSWPDTSDYTTRDNCKQRSIQTEDGKKDEVHGRYMNKSFSTQLMNMLNSETESGSEVVRWLPDGSGFVIKRQNEFEQQILPKYFDGPCIFQSFVRKLYRWGFKQIDRRASGSYIFKNEEFHRESDAYLQMKPIRHHKSQFQEASKDDGNGEENGNSFGGQHSVSERSRSDGNRLAANFRAQGVDAPLITSPSPAAQGGGEPVANENIASRLQLAIPLAASYQFAHFGAQGINAQSATSPSQTEQGSSSLTANENISRLPLQFAPSQNELISQLSAALTNYPPLQSTMPLQNDPSSILHGVTLDQLNWMQQQIQQQIHTFNNNASQIAPSNNQGPDASTGGGGAGYPAQGNPFLATGEAPIFLPPNMTQQAPGQAPNYFQPLTNNTQIMQQQTMTSASFPNAAQGYNPPMEQPVPQLNTMQQQIMTFTLFPNAAQGYKPPKQQPVPQLGAPNKQLLSLMQGNRAPFHQQAMHSCWSAGGPNADTTTTTASSTAASSSSQDQAKPPSNKKRTRSLSPPDK